MGTRRGTAAKSKGPGKRVQATLPFRPGRGGKRKGAGRKPKNGVSAGVSHDTRATHKERFPVHVTLKLRREVSPLRTKVKAKAIRAAVAQSIARGFRIVDWSIQGDHIHLTAEPGGTGALSMHMRGLSIRIARALNRALGREGTVFADRYHVHVLTTPREVRRARAYVMLNARRHAPPGRPHARSSERGVGASRNRCGGCLRPSSSAAATAERQAPSATSAAS